MDRRPSQSAVNVRLPRENVMLHPAVEYIDNASLENYSLISLCWGKKVRSHVESVTRTPLEKY